MPLPHQLGTLTPVIYTECAAGHIVLLPYSDCPTPSGCEYLAPVTSQRCGLAVHREGADTLAKIGKLERRLTAQENSKLEAEAVADHNMRGAALQRVRDNLLQKLYSSATPEAERDFIREWLKLSDERRARHEAKYAAYSVYVHAAHYDLGNRRADEERNPS